MRTVFKLLCNVSLCLSDQQKIQNEVGSIPYEAVSRDGDDRTQEWNPGASPVTVIYHFFRILIRIQTVARFGYNLLTKILMTKL